jgi:hypothetical protein
VLYVVDPARWRAPAVSELDGGEVPAPAGRWGVEATAALLAGLGVLAVLVAAAAATRAGTVQDGAGVLVLAAAACLLGCATGLPDLGRTRVALALCGWIVGGLGAWSLAGPGTASGLAAGALAVAAAALATYPVLLALAPGVAFAGPAAVAAAGAVAAGARPEPVAVVVLALGLVLLRVLTPAWSWLAGAVTAGLDEAAMAARSRWLRMAMASVSAALVAVVLGAVPALLAAGPAAERGR